jgi:hypothetical protein
MEQSGQEDILKDVMGYFITTTHSLRSSVAKLALIIGKVQDAMNRDAPKSRK